MKAALKCRLRSLLLLLAFALGYGLLVVLAPDFGPEMPAAVRLLLIADLVGLIVLVGACLRQFIGPVEDSRETE